MQENQQNIDIIPYFKGAESSPVMRMVAYVLNSQLVGPLITQIFPERGNRLRKELNQSNESFNLGLKIHSKLMDYLKPVPIKFSESAGTRYFAMAEMQLVDYFNLPIGNYKYLVELFSSKTDAEILNLKIVKNNRGHECIIEFKLITDSNRHKLLRLFGGKYLSLVSEPKQRQKSKYKQISKTKNKKLYYYITQRRYDNDILDWHRVHNELDLMNEILQISPNNTITQVPPDKIKSYILEKYDVTLLPDRGKRKLLSW